MAKLSADINGLSVEIETVRSIRPQETIVAELFNQLEVFKEAFNLNAIIVTNPATDEYRIEIGAENGRAFNQDLELLDDGFLISWDAPDTLQSDEIAPFDGLRGLIIELARRRDLTRIDAEWD